MTREDPRPPLPEVAKSSPPPQHAAALREWEVVPSHGGEAAGAGLEILVLDEDGRIETDYQFIEG